MSLTGLLRRLFKVLNNDDEWQGKVVSPRYKQFEGTTNISHCIFFKILAGRQEKFNGNVTFSDKTQKSALIFNAGQLETLS